MIEQEEMSDVDIQRLMAFLDATPQNAPHVPHQFQQNTLSVDNSYEQQTLLSNFQKQQPPHQTFYHNNVQFQQPASFNSFSMGPQFMQQQQMAYPSIQTPQVQQPVISIDPLPPQLQPQPQHPQRSMQPPITLKTEDHKPQPQTEKPSEQDIDKILDEIHGLQQKQKEQLEKIQQFQNEIVMRPQQEGFDLLKNQHQQLKESILEELRTLTCLFQQVILSPRNIHKVVILLQEVKKQQIQLELYMQELNCLTLDIHHPQRNQPVCVLVIVEQPFPMVVSKDKQLDEDPIVVQLMTGASVDVQSFSPVRVVMMCDNHQVQSNSNKAIQHDTQNMDNYTHSAKFFLKFMTGTRKNPVRLKFGVQIQLQRQGQPQTVTVESDASRLFIVITNECQWEESEGILLKEEAFGDQQQITWPEFANVLQRHFLRATRQDFVTPRRPLSVFDFDYFHQKFFAGQSHITQKDYDAFWDWYGKSLQKIRYQRGHVCQLFQEGLIYGFIPRNKVKEALIGEQVGTFLIRLSERHPGLFAVGYKTDDPNREKSVRHYLIKPDDIPGNKKTLPDFLKTCVMFQYLLQVTPEIENGQPRLRKFQRDVVLHSYYSKPSGVINAQGYDDSLPTPSFPSSLPSEQSFMS
eukprot:CAMPEP_0174269982 /NCGR_PEP_ID=MMETSP0439-20130205/42865_1 /TAXON_ID=0 /ORGANISM="Stereomyxa ramosa, Strain Chinc5" /LENGTH=631 /DNA_ID=CAMNT_0015359029 /DNA_START=52 /DNA_END=1947 /DNA_ORIENTATION=-